MALEIHWSKPASRQFDSILEYLGNEWGQHSVSLFVKKVYDVLDILSTFPEIGSVENRELSIRGFVIVKQLTVFYQIRGEKIVLLNFYDNRQRPKLKRFYKT
jgi:plasmid stabilization system protein ParE